MNSSRLLDFIEDKAVKLAVAVGLAGVFLFYCKAYRINLDGNIGNLTVYILCAIVFFVVYGIIIFGFSALLKRKIIHGPAWLKLVLTVLFFLWTIRFLTDCYKNELDQYAFPGSYFRHIIPSVAYLGILVVFFLSVLTIFLHNAKNRGLHVKAFRFFFGGLMAFLQGLFLFAPNPLLDDSGRIYHIDAYVTSIFNVLAGTPYEMYSNSIYGHHGLFFFWPMKILKAMGLSSWNAFSLTIASIGFFTFACEYWCMAQVLKNDVTYSLALLSNAMISFQVFYNQYYQLIPHRFLFQPIILAGCIWVFRKDSSIRRGVMWCLSALAMLWNIEIGAVVSLVWFLAACYLDCRKKTRLNFVIIIKNSLLLGAMTGAGYGVVNLHNILVGGNVIDWLTYIYPICSKTFLIEMLQLQLMKPNSGGTLVILILLGTIGTLGIRAVKMKLEEHEFVLLLTAIMGYGVFTYHMNRVVTTNATIVSFCFIMIIAWLCENFWNSPDNKLAKAGDYICYITVQNVISVTCLFLMSGMSLAAISTVGATVENKCHTTWNMRNVREVINEANEMIPKDTVAFGENTTVLFAMIDRTTGIYIADWEDMGISWAGTMLNEEAFDRLQQLLEENQYKHILINANQRQYVPAEYDRISEMEFNGVSYEVYEHLE